MDNLDQVNFTIIRPITFKNNEVIIIKIFQLYCRIDLTFYNLHTKYSLAPAYRL